MKGLLSFIFACMLLTGCKKKESDNDQTGLENDTTSVSYKIPFPKENIVLSSKAQEATSNWLAYITTSTEIENFKQYSVKDVISNAKPISEIMLNLKETIPDSLQTNAVRSRVNVLVTKALILKQLTEKAEPRPGEIAETAQEIPKEFNNLNIQLNELYLKTLGDFEEELDVYESQMDSLDKASRATYKGNLDTIN